MTEAISASMVALYALFNGHDRTTARRYLNDGVVVCIPENILPIDKAQLGTEGSEHHVIDGRVAFQTVTLMSANRTAGSN